MSHAPIKPTHKAIQEYYHALEKYSAQDVSHELALRSAFQNLLSVTGHEQKWTLIPELSLKLGGKSVRPDGTFRDEWQAPRGFWEAKDTADDLDAEIKKKAAKGYPLSNTIFEDTRTAVLFQNGAETFRIPLRDRGKLADLLNTFYSHTIPEIEGFDEAVEAFKERIPDLARGLDKKIKVAHEKNNRFQAAFADFLGLCKIALNPNIRVEAVDEMLVQHLLTERLFRTIFENADFTRRNVIAAEIEKVIDALTSGSFSRAEFLKSLDRFYRAIEGRAATIEDFSQKQHFLNTIYERFFQGYSIKVADTHGIVYTPQEIVDFMCASVEEVLRTEFGKGLGDPGVTILDPCTGTGNFLVNLMRRIPKKDLPRVYREQLFANEVMLLPYYIASMNIEHEYFELTGGYEAFEGMCFVDTLELADIPQQKLEFMTEKNTERVMREKRAAVKVIIGNPPYNMNQQNENDNNKNRAYKIVDSRIRRTYVKLSKAQNKSALNDAYIKFFRWATDRIGLGEGIICFVTNNNFIDDKSFDGFRKYIPEEFASFLHVDLHGNVRRNRKLSGTTHNVFGIQPGVGITIAIKRKKVQRRGLYYHRVPETWKRREKLHWLEKVHSFSNVALKRMKPSVEGGWIKLLRGDEFGSFLPLSSKSCTTPTEKRHTIFQLDSVGVKTNRDEIVYDYDQSLLSKRAARMVDDFNAEVDRFNRAGDVDNLDDFVSYDRIKWSESLKKHLATRKHAQFDSKSIVLSLWRPFTTKWIYYNSTFNERQYKFPRILPQGHGNAVNEIACCTNHAQSEFSTIVTPRLPNEAVGGRSGQCFPFYIYDEDGTNRRENITDWALKTFQSHYKNKKITKWDIFYYVYGVLHQPEYRATFADNLKRELPRVPFMSDFRAFAEAGQTLAKWHIEYESVEPWPLQWVETPGVPLSYEVVKMKLSKDKTALKVNESLTLAEVPPEVFRYRLGNRSALEWVVDQYQVSEDARSGIKSDPNRAEDPEYIVRLVGQVVRVSVETVRIVDALPSGLGVGLTTETPAPPTE